MTGTVAMRSQATGWRGLADDLLRAIDWLDSHGASGEPAIRITVAADRRSLSLCACDAPDGEALDTDGPATDSAPSGRLDGAPPVSAHIAPAKAHTAALGRRESKLYEDVINGGRTSFLSAPAVAGMLEGGVPILKDGQCAGRQGSKRNLSTSSRSPSSDSRRRRYIQPAEPVYHVHPPRPTCDDEA